MIVPGPCLLCDEREYELSPLGRGYCPRCAAGIPPEVTRVRRLLADERSRIIRAAYAAADRVDGPARLALQLFAEGLGRTP